MSIEVKDHTIHIRSTGESIPATKEEFQNYYRGIDVFRRKEQRHGNCVCPAGARLQCDMNCAECPYHRCGTLSLDAETEDADGGKCSLGDFIADPSADIGDAVTVAGELRSILGRLNEIMPEAMEIGELRLEGLSDLEIAERIGVKRTTFLSRINRAKELLMKEFPDIVEFL